MLGEEVDLSDTSGPELLGMTDNYIYVDRQIDNYIDNYIDRQKDEVDLSDTSGPELLNRTHNQICWFNTPDIYVFIYYVGEPSKKIYIRNFSKFQAYFPPPKKLTFSSEKG